MSRSTSISRLARSAGLDPEDVVLALIERGVDLDDPDRLLDGATRKVARAVVRELLGGPSVVKPLPAEADREILALTRRSASLVATLSVDDVLFIHSRLCDDFASTEDPIDPPGVRSMPLLESAVGRQHSGFDGLLKYHDPILNAASLLYGICNDHPFHNGNKRTALVAALAHLDKNRLVVTSARQRDVLRLMVAVADHALVYQPVKIGKAKTTVRRRGAADEEVVAIATWLRTRVVEASRGEAQITYRELRQILANFGFSMGSPRGSKVPIMRLESRRFLRSREQVVMSLDWPGDGRPVAVSTIKHVRRTLRLCEEDGVTRDIFYGQGVRIDRFINDYRLVLRRLATR